MVKGGRDVPEIYICPTCATSWNIIEGRALASRISEDGVWIPKMTFATNCPLCAPGLAGWKWSHTKEKDQVAATA